MSLEITPIFQRKYPVQSLQQILLLICKTSVDCQACFHHNLKPVTEKYHLTPNHLPIKLE